MSEFLPRDHPRMGTLEIATVFEYYDAPVLFSALDELGHAYLALSVESTADTATYLYVPISDKRLANVATGLVTLREAIEEPESPTVFNVTVSATHTGPPEVTALPSSWIPPAWLPAAGETLAVETDTATPFSSVQLGQAAAREGRELVGIEVEQPANVLRTEMPFRINGPLMTEFQGLVDAIAGPTDFSTVDLQAASFVIVATPLVGSDSLFADGSAAISAVQELLLAAGDDEAFKSYLAGLNRRKQSHVRDFFSVLADAGTGINFFAADRRGQVSENEVTLDRLQNGLKVLRASKELPDEDLTVVGFLDAINHSRRSFVVVEPGVTRGRKARRYGGLFDASLDIEGAASGRTVLYRFGIRREAKAADFDEDRVAYTNRLVSMSRIGEQEELGAQ